MAKDKITEYDATAANNTVVGDVNLAENSALPSDMNNAVRELMSHQKEAFGSGTPLYVDQTNNRLGVGTTSPGHLLHLKNNNPTIRLEDSDGASNIYGLVQSDGSGSVYLVADDGNNAGSSKIQFYIDGGEKLRIQTGGGISFNGDTATANALDDYETGSISSSNLTDQSGAGLSLTFNAGNYVKVGTLVHFELDFSFPTTSNSSQAQISALPFTFQSNFGSGSIGYHTRGADTTNYSIGNTTNLRFASNVGANLTNAQLSGVRMILSITYRST